MAAHHIRGQGVFRNAYVYNGSNTLGASAANFDGTKFFPSGVPSIIIIKKTTNVGATTVTLPYAVYQGTFVWVKDGLGDAFTNNITVQPASTQPTGTIDGASTYVIKSNYGAALFLFDGTEWKLFDANASTAAGNLYLSGLLYESASDALTAAGTGQSNALPLTSELNSVSTVAAGTGVNLPASAPGLTILVWNGGANPLHVYPFQGATDTIDGNAATTGVVQMQGSVTIYMCTAAGAWKSEGIGTGYSGSFPTTSYTDAITASTTHSIAGGTPLTTVLNRVTTANASDAVTLPIAAPGMQLTVINASANTITVYPGQAGDQINALGAGSPLSITTTAKTVNFYCTVAGQWHTITTA